MRILALEPYHGGSHKAFLDGWSAHSRHEWEILALPAHKWRWRMRHGAVTLARLAAERMERGERWDLVFCSDMLNLAEFLGLAPAPLRELPHVVYFHESQLTYPVREPNERDLHFAFTNFTTALAADAVWFNTAWHRDIFLKELENLLGRMPDYHGLEGLDILRETAAVEPPGVERLARREAPSPPSAPLRILWAARWEYDKDPDAFFDALGLLAVRDVAFRLSVIGQQFRDRPPVFDRARKAYGDRIDRWGYQFDRTEYEAALREADVVVSTAIHEFFGLSLVEAAMAGAFPLVPERLAYPEVFRADAEGNEIFFYDGTPADLADALALLDRRRRTEGDLWDGDPERALRTVERFAWGRRAPALDAALEKVRPRRPVTFLPQRG
jgi:glycosyltransferase involved in cell wall biosynthesis